MLALVTTDDSQFSAGSIGLAIARSWSATDRHVLFVDGDVEGSALAERLGEATRADYSPAERGLPTLIAARQPVTLKLVADHCFDLGTAKGSLWSLFAPFHPAGAAHAAGWLAERAAQIAELDRRRGVLVASGNLREDSPLLPLLRLVPVIVFLAPARTPEQTTALGLLCERTGLAGIRSQQRLLVTEGASSIADKTIRAASGLHVLGRLPPLEDERVLRLQGGRRERAFAREIDTLAGRLLALLDADSGVAGSAGWPRPELFVVPSGDAGGAEDDDAAAHDAPRSATAGDRGA